jgi:hypothetical protein
MVCDLPQMFDGDQQAQRQSVGRVQRPGVIASVELIPSWTLSGANTNYRTIAVYNRGTSGAGTALVASLDLTSGVDLTRGVPKALTLGTGADRTVAVGDMLEWISTTTGSGAPAAGGRVIVQQTNGV